jgi:hypothetical protein
VGRCFQHGIIRVLSIKFIQFIQLLYNTNVLLKLEIHVLCVVQVGRTQRGGGRQSCHWRSTSTTTSSSINLKQMIVSLWEKKKYCKLLGSLTRHLSPFLLPFVLGRVKKAQMMVVLLPLVDAKKRTDKKIHTISDGLLVNHL